MTTAKTVKKSNAENSSEVSRGKGKAHEQATVVWGAPDFNDFLKVPRAALYIRSILADNEAVKRLKPNHLLLLLILASHRYKSEPIQIYWIVLAKQMGIPVSTIRRWAYALVDMKILKIKRSTRRDPSQPTGYRNDRNVFDISPFVSLVAEAYEIRKRRPSRRRIRREK